MIQAFHTRGEEKKRDRKEVINRKTNSSSSKLVSVTNVNNLTIISFAPKVVLVRKTK